MHEPENRGKLQTLHGPYELVYAGDDQGVAGSAAFPKRLVARVAVPGDVPLNRYGAAPILPAKVPESP